MDHCSSSGNVKRCRGESGKEGRNARLKTELSGVEDHRDAVHHAIARLAYALYELGGRQDGLDLEHWFRAERELTVLDVPLSVEESVVTVRVAMDQFSGSPMLISISARSLLIVSVPDEANNTVEPDDRDILRFVSLPVEIDPARVACEVDGGEVALKLPLAVSTLGPDLRRDRR